MRYSHLLPSPELTIPALLKCQLPETSTTKASFDDNEADAAGYFDNDPPNLFDVPAIIKIPRPPTAIVNRLASHIDPDICELEEREIPTPKSVRCAHLNQDRSVRLPLRVIALWQDLAAVEEARNGWEKVMTFLEKAEFIDDTAQPVLALLNQVVWSAKTAGFSPAGRTHISHLPALVRQYWLSDEQMNLSIEILGSEIQKHRGARIEVQSTWLYAKLREVWPNNTMYASGKPFAWMRKRGKRMVSGGLEVIGLMINLDRRHWVAAVVNIPAQEILFGDSLGGKIPSQVRDVLKWWTKHHTGHDFAIGPLPIGAQKDGVSCALYAWNALASYLLPGIHRVLTNESDLLALRLYLLKRALEIHVQSVRGTNTHSTTDVQEAGGNKDFEMRIITPSVGTHLAMNNRTGGAGDGGKSIPGIRGNVSLDVQMGNTMGAVDSSGIVEQPNSDGSNMEVEMESAGMSANAAHSGEAPSAKNTNFKSVAIDSAMIVEGKGQRFQIKHDAAQVTSSIPHNTESHIEPAPPSQLGSQDAHFQWMPQAILNPSVPPPPGCEQLLEAGRFVIQLMRSKADSRAAVLPPREDLLPLKLQIELEQIASGCYKAFENQKRVEWSYSDYQAASGRRQSHAGDVREEELLKEFPGYSGSVLKGGATRLEDQATVITDNKGNILLWYLPHIIGRERQEEILLAVEWFSKTSPLAFSLDDKLNFRTSSGEYSQEPSTLANGIASLAGSWHMYGDEDIPPRPSRSMRNPDIPSSEFLLRMKESLAVLGAILAVIQPALFLSGIEVLGYLADGGIETLPTDREVLKVVANHWASPFSALSVINNRQTDIHRDLHSPKSCYDLLYTGGAYSNGRFDVPALGLRARYEPGTVVGLLARIFPHGAASVKGTRFCLVQYFKQDMLRKHPFFRWPFVPSIRELERLYCVPPTDDSD